MSKTDKPEAEVTWIMVPTKRMEATVKRAIKEALAEPELCDYCYPRGTARPMAVVEVGADGESWGFCKKCYPKKAVAAIVKLQ